VPVVRFRFPNLTTPFGVEITGKWRLLGGTVQTGAVLVTVDTASTSPIHRLCPRVTPSALLVEVTGTTLPSSAPDGEREGRKAREETNKKINKEQSKQKTKK
jgi:hypothetical protein